MTIKQLRFLEKKYGTDNPALMVVAVNCVSLGMSLDMINYEVVLERAKKAKREQQR